MALVKRRCSSEQCGIFMLTSAEGSPEASKTMRLHFIHLSASSVCMGYCHLQIALLGEL